ncbi:FAD-linked oxidase C-terminal domain-containing protein [Fulvivirgaceae bacterium BMA12]|uniref:FAD-linked oxidase C-terminal domain-containing protein n=1 Tax=Agaribacillus aureus TaxID=3051825 RepID=A0ABT8LI54_9BACT|nr:FAD-linked oxidase C-terminal domain-containing protein [Fulvivirgaceae bacterium BMA12]
MSKKLITALSDRIKGEVLSDEYALGMYATDASIYQIKPQVVVLPLDNEDVKAAMDLAREHQVSILPRGGGTSLAGQTVGASMVLDFSKHMNEIIEINAEERWVRVQPGMARDDLNALLEPYGLHFAPDPATSSRANVGGMVGNNSSGTKSILYGKTVDHVLEAKVLLADGTELHFKEFSKNSADLKQAAGVREKEIYQSFEKIIDENREEIKTRFPKVMRRVGGYNLDEFVYTDRWNLSKLICGSEGTLATTLELKLHLEPLPKYKSVAVVHYASLLEAIGAVEPILRYKPSAVEILDGTVVALSRKNLTTQRHCHFIEGDPEAILIVEFYGDSREDVLERGESMIRDQKEKKLGYAYPLFPEGKEYNDVWVVRKKGLGLMLGLKGDKKPLPFIEDAGIPLEHLPEYIDRVLKVCKKHNTEAAMYAHASVGVIHVRPILDLRQAEDIKRLKNIADETFALVQEYGGSWSGEHGDGLVRSWYNKSFFGEQLYAAFREVKKLFDPENLMNPGKIIEAQSIEENLRYGSKYSDTPVKSTFFYREENGFAASVHMCTGVGECRKMLGGTMCPSFKATRDEEHSTRGRANALRMAMSNQLDDNGLASERLHEVMDLCLSCKACKSECPSNVDMAKMKSDTLQLYYDHHGTTLRDRLIRDSAKMAANMGGWKGAIVNFVQDTGLFRLLFEKTTKFDKRRKLPAYAREPFFRWAAKNVNGSNKGHKKVVLFADTYLNFHEPAVGKAALHLLDACGYEVIIANVGCCQRPKISHGFLREARKEGKETALALKTYLDQGLKVVVCEPSCASALNDDLPDLLEDEQLGRQLKDGVMMIDVFLAEELASGGLDVSFESVIDKVAVHGHCHQKALFGTGAMQKIYENAQTNTTEIPSGCCGMAGSFGYEKEHYDLSEKIGASILFPAVDRLKEDHTIVACGFSCRHQIKHFTGVEARHWVETVTVKPRDKAKQ